MSNTVLYNFETTAPAELLERAQQVISSMTDNAYFPEPWPAPAPALAQVTADMNTLQSENMAVVNGDLTHSAARDTATQTLALSLKRVGRYAEFTADDQQEALTSCGFELRQPRVRTVIPEPLPPPAGIKVTRGELSGTVTIRVQRLAGAGSYEVQMTTGDPTVEANWLPAGTYLSCRGMDLTELAPGKNYSFRVRGIGRTGPGAWSIAASLMVV